MNSIEPDDGYVGEATEQHNHRKPWAWWQEEQARALNSALGCTEGEVDKKQLLAVLTRARMIEGMRTELSSNYSRINDTSRTVTAESKAVARKNADDIKVWLRDTRNLIDEAIKDLGR